MMTEHQRIMLKRHLESAIRYYISVAETLESEGIALGHMYRSYAAEASIIIHKLDAGKIRVD